MVPVIAALPPENKYFVTLDNDRLVPSVMRGTVLPASAGLMRWHIVELFEALAAKGGKYAAEFGQTCAKK